MKIIKWTIALYAFALIVIGATAVLAEQKPGSQRVELMCGPGPKVTHRLKMEYGEELVATGTVRGQALAVFASRTGSFTVLLVQPSGLACFLSTGEDWEHLGFGEPGPERGAL